MITARLAKNNVLEACDTILQICHLLVVMGITENFKVSARNVALVISTLRLAQSDDLAKSVSG